MNKSIIIPIALISISSNAQTDTLYFNKNWKLTSKDSAKFYRPDPKKVKTLSVIPHIPYKIFQADSIYWVKDYYMKSKTLQFEGYLYDKNAIECESENCFNYKYYNENECRLNNTYLYENEAYTKESKWRTAIKNWQPIFYVEYFYADRHQFKAGMEFCLSCENDTKFFIGAGYGLVNYNGKLVGLPDFHLSMNNYEKTYFVKVGGSDKNLYATTGFTFLNAMDLGIGYSFPFSKNEVPKIEGFTVGLTIRLTRNKNAIGRLKMKIIG